MMEFFGLNQKKYTLVIAELYLCVPAALESIIKSEGYQEYDMYRIANTLGVMLPPLIRYPQVYRYKYTTDPSLYGTVIRKDTINHLFFEYNLPLCEQYTRITTIGRDLFSSYLFDVLSSGKHIICGYEYHTLHESLECCARHVSIITDVDPISEYITLLDPGPNNAGSVFVSSNVLYRAISNAKDGLWVIS